MSFLDNCAVTEKPYIARDVQPTVLRLHPDTREALVRLAKEHGRSLSKEIALRLDASLREEGGGALPNELQRTVDGVREPAPVDGWSITEMDKAMLAVFRSLPPEKQLALLSLFR